MKSKKNCFLFITSVFVAMLITLQIVPLVGVQASTEYRYWYNLGQEGFSTDYVNFTSMAIDKDGTPYIVYKDSGVGSRAMVKKFDGLKWVIVGQSGISVGNAAYTTIAIDGNGVPYIAYADLGNNDKVIVMKYNGESWESVGESVSSGSVAYTSIAIDSENVPYIAYADVANGQKVTVEKYTGTDWETVGNAGVSTGAATGLTIKIDSSKNIYVGYRDVANSNKATVMKYDGTSWNAMGGEGFTIDEASMISLDVSHKNVYIAFSDVNQKAEVKEYNSNTSTWDAIGMPGEAGFSTNAINYTSMVTDSNGILYLAYSDLGQAGKATVMKYNGTSWSAVGTNGFTKGGCGYPSLTISSDDQLYIGYMDNGNGGKASVMTYGVDLLADKEIAYVKTLIPDSFVATEGEDVNILSYIYKIAGISDAGVVLSLDSKYSCVAEDGEIVYGDSMVTEDITVCINREHGTEDFKTITVTVPAKTVALETFYQMQINKNDLVIQNNNIEGSVEVGINTNTQEMKSVKVVLTIYDNRGELNLIIIKDIVLKEGDNDVVFDGLNVATNSEKSYSYKVLLWNDMQNNTPLTQAISGSIK